MANVYCSLFLMFAVLTTMIAVGLINIFNKDLAWRIAESMLRAVRPQRNPEWERGATIKGNILLVFGVLWIVLLLSIILR